jgi:hypothetical protein
MEIEAGINTGQVKPAAKWGGHMEWPFGANPNSMIAAACELPRKHGVMVDYV